MRKKFSLFESILKVGVKTAISASKALEKSHKQVEKNKAKYAAKLERERKTEGIQGGRLSNIS
jgi:hypothetical protein